ncbi:UDP-N-acetylmuramoyl-tripeptide--D-alanyl-D-alanine ligase [Glaciecola petra]|uniref:UDP-N-acetylmuramoyl-tripeptide--D-alanyl-D-alanine ligase n=1 Tax=Glaciecola petra TaxID=3075602 RepID=A0ABU2ZM69_9ALTE|nr:UDP-N-acetylmuramoyl-tripeptide--D-alanyl-D-alanine ligase [Aestuariibacter sp. P117]MDT0593495.1 UDP-N-acetylmuramoyl-tripeptide--D-alanyl-D-alanine ligase [Aestuariibacter sp. P117]
MIEVSLDWVAKAVDGDLLPTSAKDLKIKQVSTDTRSIKAGDLFIALIGDKFDAHDYLDKAIEQNVSALIISDKNEHVKGLQSPTILVKDTRIALGQLATKVKQSCKVKTVGITGSSGKTTVKEMTSSILKTRGKVLATKGNFNNDIGVPLTLLDIEAQHDYAVIEMGANHQGEIEYTCNLAKPDVAAIINAAPAHIEGFGSLFGVARAKSEIIKGLDKNAVVILNHDSSFFEFWQGKSSTQQILSFSYDSDKGDFHAQKVSINKEGCAEFELVTPIGNTAIRLRVPGTHNVGNAVLAAALSISVGANLANVKEGLFAMQSVAGRLNVSMVNSQIKLLDDTYNANVGSVKAALDLLASFDGFKVFVFGDMGELGDQAPMYHEQIGEYAKQHQIDALISCGELSAFASSAMQNQGMACQNVEEALEALIQLISPLVIDSHQKISSGLAADDQSIIILVKGSRGARMERVIDAIQAYDFDPHKLAAYQLRNIEHSGKTKITNNNKVTK